MHATTDEVMDENDAALSSYLHSIYIFSAHSFNNQCRINRATILKRCYVELLTIDMFLLGARYFAAGSFADDLVRR